MLSIVATHIASDLAIFALPFFLLPSLRASGRITGSSLGGLIAIFSLGGLCIGCTIGRTISVGLVTSLPLIGAWSAAEQALCIIVACCPPLKWLWLSIRYFGWKLSDRGVYADGSPRRSVSMVEY